MFPALIVAVAVSQGARVESPVPYFEVHSGFWQNLHHFLYELGQRKRVAEGADLWVAAPIDHGPLGLTAAEQPVWDAAVEHYARTWAEKDALFDDDLGELKQVLAAHEADAALPEDLHLPAATRQVLESVAPLYRRAMWPRHDAANRRWFKERAPEVAEAGPVVVPMLERAFDAKFPKAVRLELVGGSTGGGAYTSLRGGPFIVASTLDPRSQDRAGTEILFHESAHAMMESVRPALGPTAGPKLWHAVLFWTVGEALHRHWPDYVPYAEREGVFTELRAPIAAAWLRRLDGKPRLQVAADDLLKRVGAPDPDVAAARAQTVVTGTRTERRLEDAVVPTEVITRAQLEAVGAKNLEQLLLQQPGVEMEYSFRGAGVSLQGLGPEYVLVLIDGERQTGRVGNLLDLTRYSLRDIERVEIIKGPAAALYGSDAIGGVINLITHRPRAKLELLGRAQGGFTNGPGQGLKGDLIDARGHAATKLGWFEGKLGAGYQTQGSYDYDPRDVATSGAGFSRWDVDGLLAAELFGGKARVSAKAGYLRRDLQAVDLAPSGAVFDRRQRSEQFDATVRFDAQPAEHTRLSLWGHTGLFRDQLQQDQRGAAFLDTYTASLDRIYTVDAQLDQQLAEHALSAGVQFLKESLFSSRLSQVGDRYRVGVFVQDEWDVPGLGAVKAKLLPGLRVDVDSQFGTAPTPRLALKLDPHPNVTLRASYGWGFRAPSFQELYLLFENTSVGYVVEGNPKLLAERSQSLNLAADVRLPLEGWLVSASLFHTELTDLITIDTSAPIDPINPTRFKYGNVSSAYAQGLEASLRMRLSRGTYVDLGYVLTDARDNVRQAALAGRAVHKVSGQLTSRYRPLGLELVVRATFIGPRPFYIDENGDGIEQQVWTRGMVNLDAQLTWHPFGWGAIFVGGTNLLNAGDAVYVPQPPRRLTAGVQLEY
ncbi:MAG: TonB-dependent receptor [Archangiaceae bacterium]|nr:TonB-dependent receptor [Archangiaceae bacterium]